MNVSGLLWLSATLPVFLGAATLARAYVSSHHLWLLGISLCLYTVGNLMMVQLMRGSGLGVAIAVSSVAQLVLANLIAVAAFHEHPSSRQMLGIILGIAALALIAWPRNG